MLFILPGAGGGFMPACRRIHPDEIPAHRFNLCWQLEIKNGRRMQKLRPAVQLRAVINQVSGQSAVSL